MKQIRSTFSSDLTNSKLNALCFKREHLLRMRLSILYTTSDDDDDI